MICDNNRAVTLLGTTYKILANILYVKLVPHAQEIIGEYQGGFRKEINCWSNFYHETNTGKMVRTEYGHT